MERKTRVTLQMLNKRYALERILYHPVFMAISPVHHDPTILIFALKHPDGSCKNDRNHQAPDQLWICKNAGEMLDRTRFYPRSDLQL